MKRIFALVAVTTCLSVWAQDTIPPADGYVMPQGRWSINVDWNPYSLGWTCQDITGAMDFSGFGVMGIGLGAEYAYRDNRSVRLDANAAVIGHNHFSIGCSDGEAHYPERIVNSVVVNATHLFYHRHWAYGGGLSFNYRHVDYSGTDWALYQEDDASDYVPSSADRSIMRKCGEYSFDLWHYSVGLNLVCGYRLSPNFMVGLRYTPFLTTKSSFKYYHADCPLPSHGVSRIGHLEHQLSFLLNWRINLTKRTPRQPKSGKLKSATAGSATPQSYIDTHGRRQSTGVVRPKANSPTHGGKIALSSF